MTNKWDAEWVSRQEELYENRHQKSRHENKDGYKNELAIEFDRKYSHILSVLKDMPCTTKEEKESRITWIKNHKDQQSFFISIFKTCKPVHFQRLINNAYNTENTLDSERGVATLRRKGTIDEIVFYEAVYEAISEYTGENKKGEKYLFAQSVGLKYRQLAQKEAGENDLLPEGIKADISKRKAHNIIALANNMKRMSEQLGNKETVKRFILDEKSGITKKLSKKDIELALDIAYELKVFSLDADDRMQYFGTFDEEMQTWKTRHDSGDSQKKLSFNDLQKDFVENWNTIMQVVGKRYGDILKALFSKDILIALKLEELNESMRESYKDMLEPYCKDWCWKRKSCLKSERERKCYIRYGERQECAVNGSVEIYNMLKKLDRLYEAVLDNDYVGYAYQKKVSNLQDMLHNKLKPFKGDREKFEFTDAVIANVLGERTDKVSKCRKVQYSKMQTALWNMYMDFEKES